MVRIALTGVVCKVLNGRLQQADATHTPFLVQRIHALLWLGEGTTVVDIAQLFAAAKYVRFLTSGIERARARLGRREFVPHLAPTT